jgi:transcription antitermination factor NusG
LIKTPLLHILDKYLIWNALYLKSRQEKKVAREYEKFGLDFYLPLAKRLSVWSDRKKWVEDPLFRGYIFVPQRLKDADKFLYIPGVVGYVNYNGKRAEIKQAELKIIQEFIEKGYHVEAASKEDLEKGDKVAIASGTLKGLEGTVIESQGESYFMIAVEGIGQVIKVKVPKEVLIKIPDEK